MSLKHSDAATTDTADADASTGTAATAAATPPSPKSRRIAELEETVRQRDAALETLTRAFEAEQRRLVSEAVDAKLEAKAQQKRAEAAERLDWESTERADKAEVEAENAKVRIKDLERDLARVRRERDELRQQQQQLRTSRAGLVVGGGWGGGGGSFLQRQMQQDQQRLNQLHYFQEQPSTAVITGPPLRAWPGPKAAAAAGAGGGGGGGGGVPAAAAEAPPKS